MADETTDAAQALEQMRADVDARVLAEAAEFGEGAKQAGKPSGPELNSELVRDCIYQGERGAGIVGALACREIYRYDFSRKCFLGFNGFHLEIDKVLNAHADIPEAAVRVFLSEALAISKEAHAAEASGDKDKAKELGGLRKRAYKIVEKLRTERGRQNALKLAITNGVFNLGVSGQEIDQDPWAIPCRNTVIDARTGENRRTPKIDDFQLRAAPVDWLGISCPAPGWEQFLMETQNGDAEMVAFLQRALGSALIRKRTHDQIFIFSGRGRGGKSTMLETVCDALGDLASPLPVAMFIESGRGGGSAGAATPELELLRGLALGYASEVDGDKRMAQGAAKRISGGDTQISRGLFGCFEKLKTTWTIFLLLNDVPAAAESDYALWERLLIVRFPLSFVDRDPAADFERRADGQLVHKLKSELPGVLAWLVRGAIAFLERGLDPPSKVREEVEDEKAENDFISDFLLTCCEQGAHLCEGSTVLYTRFSKLWEDSKLNPKYRPSQRVFGKALRSKEFRKSRDKFGRVLYHGLALKAED